MKLDRGVLLRVTLVALTLVGLVWLWSSTEWIEERVPLPPRGEAAHDGAFAAKLLAQRLGARVSSPDGLAAMPPPRATLVLASPYWALFTGRDEALRRWVEGGGHLVIEAREIDSGQLKPWLAMETQPAKRKVPQSCGVLREREGLGTALAEGRGFVRCGYAFERLHTTRPALWALDDDGGDASVLRIAVSRGRVTVLAGGFDFNPWARSEVGFGNHGLARGDNAALFAALLDLRSGDEVWFVTREQQLPFLPWLWERGWPVIALAALALALALWRGFARFGPLMAEPPATRRSMGEQIRGMAEFLWHRQPQALHAAQSRALDEAARRHVNGWARLDAHERVLALARASGADVRRLSAALDGQAARTLAAWADALAEIESVRRALLRPKERTP